MRGLVLALFLVGCASPKAPLAPPVDTKPPTVNTDSLGSNIKEIENSLKRASGRVERIEILVDSLSIPE